MCRLTKNVGALFRLQILGKGKVDTKLIFSSSVFSDTTAVGNSLESCPLVRQLGVVSGRDCDMCRLTRKRFCVIFKLENLGKGEVVY